MKTSNFIKKYSRPTGLASLLLALALVSSACTLSTNSSKTDNEASVFLSVDGGNTWREATAMATPGQPQNIRGVNVNVMAFDPQDSLAVYLASFDNGLYYTYNVVKDGWMKAKELPSATITDVKVDPKNKCVIYASSGNRLYRSEDCSRTWTQIYFDNNTGVTVNTFVIDHYNPRNLYIGTSRGEIIKSIDSGASWRTIHRLNNEGVSRLVVSPLDSRLLFVASSKNKIFSFNSTTDTSVIDSGDIERNFVISNWTDLNPVLKDYNLGNTFKQFVVCDKDGHMFIATNQTILRSPDNGITWEKLKLIQPEKDAVVNAMAVDPKNSDNIFYVTNTTFFRSTDGGATWATKKLPTNRAGRAFLVDFDNPNTLYLGTMRIK